MEKKKNYYYLSVLSVGTALLIWWIATDVLNMFPATMLPGPVRVARTFVLKLYQKKPDGFTLMVHLWSSLKTVLSGYALGVLIGVPLGIVMAWFRPVDRFVRPVFDLVKPVPGIAWIPVMIVFFGIGLMARAMIVFLSAFIACVVNSYSGIKQTRDVHLWVARTFGGSNLQQLFGIAIPTALPMIMTGLRVALGAAWSAVIASELLASSNGIGFMIQQSRGIYRPDIIIVGMITIGIMGTILTWLLGLLEKKVLKGGRH